MITVKQGPDGDEVLMDMEVVREAEGILRTLREAGLPPAGAMSVLSVAVAILFKVFWENHEGCTVHGFAQEFAGNLIMCAETLKQKETVQ
jgi:hypothetical protein